MTKTPQYRETQRFRQPWIWLMLGAAALPVVALGAVSFVGLAIVGAVAVFLYSVRLRTEVRSDGVYIKLWPLHLSFRHIPWSEVESYEAVEYSPILRFGGWGIRFSFGEVAYSTSGKEGIMIERNGKRSVLVGSGRVEEFLEAIENNYGSTR